MINQKERIKYWGQLLLLPVYGLSFLIPRNKRIWLFGSTFGRRFADNPRYLYLYLNTYPQAGIRPIWISHNKEIVAFLQKQKLEAYYYMSLKGILYSLYGKIYIFDNYSKDINFWTSGGAVKFNLWHGTGNKRANHDNKFDKVRHPKTLWEHFTTFPRRLSDEKPSHYTLATSKPLAVITSSAFNTPLNHVIIDGYPRNDMMMGAKYPHIFTKEEKAAYQKIGNWKEQGMKIDFYMPTFRDSEVDFFKVMNLEKFNEFLKVNHIIFVAKLHPKSKLKEEFAAIAYSNIYTVDSVVDPYTFMKMVDIMTADYSSAYSDFMLLNRPVVAFHYDYEKYSAETRDGYVPFEEYMPELTAKTMDELMKDTLLALTKDTKSKARGASRIRMWKYQDSRAGERLTGKIKSLVGLKAE